MAYVASKPCNLGGHRFKIGETVPAEVIQPGAAKNLIKMGIIAEGDAQEAPEATVNTITIQLHAEEGDMPLNVTQDGIQAVFDALTTNATEAVKIVQTIENPDALILLDVVESRKSVKEELKKRAAELSAEENEGEA